MGIHHSHEIKVSQSHYVINKTYEELAVQKNANQNRDYVQLHYDNVCLIDVGLMKKTDQIPDRLKDICPVIKRYLDNR
jgi:hypothetical protein